MQANDFEKRVKERMDELQLYPSASVWTEVEKRIRKEKKRRWVIFWWIFPVLVGGGVLLYMATRKNAAKPGTAMQNESKPVAKDQTDNTVTKPVQLDTVQAKKEYPATANDNDITSTATVTPLPAGSGQIVSNRTDEEINFTAGHAGKNRKKKTTTQGTADNKNGNPVATTQPSLAPRENVFTEDPAKPHEDVTVQASIVDVKKQPLPMPAEKEPRDTATNKTEIVKAAEPATTTETGAEKVRKDKKSHGWETGVYFSAGYSERIKGDLQFGRLKAANALNSAPQAPGVLITQPPGAMNGGLYLQAGFFAKRSISRNLYFKTGVSYSLYSIDQHTGIFTSYSAAGGAGMASDPGSGYYYSGNSSLFRNQYHVISVPVLLSWQINKGKKMPIEWENGFSPAVIPFAKNLVYNSNNNIYYRDDKQVHRFQLLFNTGINVKFRQSSPHPLNLGVGLNYHFTTLQKISADDRNRLFSYGIRLGWTLKK